MKFSVDIGNHQAEAGTRALFDPSKEAAAARRYEAAAERGFFRALKELRLVEKAVKAAEDDFLGEELGSLLPAEELDAESLAIERELALAQSRKAARSVAPSDLEAFGGRVDVPISIGRRR